MNTKELLENPNLTLEMLQNNLQIKNREDVLHGMRFIQMHLAKINAIYDKMFLELQNEHSALNKED